MRTPILRGRVVDAHGAPIADVDIRIHPHHRAIALAEDGTLLVERSDRIARSDGGGRFWFDADALRDPPDDWSDGEWGTDPSRGGIACDDGPRVDKDWRVVLRYAGEDASIGELDFQHGHVDLGDIGFVPCRKLCFQIVTHEGRPVRGGHLNAVLRRTGEGAAQLHRVTIDELGRAALPLFTEVDDAKLGWMLDHPRHPMRMRTVGERLRGGPHERLTLVSRPGYQVRGRLIDAAGRAMHDLLVSVLSARGKILFSGELDLFARTKSDGSFEVDGVDHEGDALAFHEGMIPRTAPDVMDDGRPRPNLPSGPPLALVELPATEREAVCIGETRTTVAGDIIVRVQDGDLAPLPGARVTLTRSEDASGVRVDYCVTDEDGRAVFRGLAPLKYWVRAEAGSEGDVRDSWTGPCVPGEGEVVLSI